MRQPQTLIQGTINPGGDNGRLRLETCRPHLRRAVLDFHRMLFNFQSIHPAAELQFYPGVNGALCQSAIKLSFIDNLCERRFRPVL